MLLRFFVNCSYFFLLFFFLSVMFIKLQSIFNNHNQTYQEKINFCFISNLIYWNFIKQLPTYIFFSFIFFCLFSLLLSSKIHICLRVLSIKFTADQLKLKFLVIFKFSLFITFILGILYSRSSALYGNYFDSFFLSINSSFLLYSITFTLGYSSVSKFT